MKQKVRLTEEQLHKVIKESVSEVLSEIGNTERGQAALGALQQRRTQQARQAQQQYGTFSNQANKYYQSADNARDYASQQRGGYNTSDRSRQMYNANQRGRDAQHAFYNNRMDRQQRNNVINNGWQS